MAISRDEALNNLARAYFQDKVEWKLWMHAAHSDLDQRSRYQRASEKYETMRSAYLDCGVIEWADIEDAWWFGIKLERPIS